METNRDFPNNTCGASRALEMIADRLADGERFYMLDEDPKHCAEIMHTVVEDIWRTRALLADAQHWQRVAHTTGEANTALTAEVAALRAQLAEREG
jgi:transposase